MRRTWSFHEPWGNRALLAPADRSRQTQAVAVPTPRHFPKPPLAITQTETIESTKNTKDHEGYRREEA